MVDKATVADCLRTPTLPTADADLVADRLAARLDRRLVRWDAERVELEFTVKDRDSVQQKATLEAWITASARTHFVATSHQADLVAAADEVGVELQRQVQRFVERRRDAHRS